ncbi:CaiB/BaiF CoA transferase family protein [Haliea atlantica]|nr:CoA transferase [Haliea sp.]|tara:strand:- start:2521 stop:4959 length:2439 start_codon:yes stop_codon:yes gene_type:complete
MPASAATPDAPFPLAGIRVLELSDAIAGAWSGKLFADAGADVIKVEPPGGDPLRRWKASAELGQSAPLAAGETGALFHYLNGNKQSRALDLQSESGREAFRALCRGADLLLIDLREAEPDLQHWLRSLQDDCPGLCVTELSNWGPQGPFSARAANEFTLQAEVGSTAYRGYADRAPLGAGGQIGEYLGGTMAAVSALVSWFSGQRSGQGHRAEVSLFETLLLCLQPYQFIHSQLEPDVPVPRSVEIPSIEPAADGWAGVCTITAQQWQAFADMIGHPELGEDPQMASSYLRYLNLDQVGPKIEAWTRSQTVAEILEEAGRRRIPAAPIGNGREVLAMAHMRERGLYPENPAGFRQSRSPYHFSAASLREPAPAPQLGESAGWGERDDPPMSARDAKAATTTGSPPPTGPLEGLRVVDFTAFWAGPFASALFAALGADVIKVESIQRPDGMRFAAGMPPDERPLWELSCITHGANTNKRDVTLDLESEAGLDLARRLIRDADIVIENFSPRVMENFGLGWEAIHALNPEAIMVRMPAFGLEGPWRDRTGFAMTIEQISGLAWLTGYADRSPLVPRGCVDPLGGMNAVFATLGALRLRDQGHGGQLVEVPLVEAGLAIAAEQVLEYSAYGTLLERNGNRMPQATPQGVFQGSDGEWLAVSVSRPQHWRALVALLEEPALQDPGLEEPAERRAREDEIEAVLLDWCAGFPAAELAERLADNGVPAAFLHNVRDLNRHPQLSETGFFQRLRHAVVGNLDYPSFPFRLDGEYLPVKRPAPLLGEHNREILRDLLGLDEAEIVALEQAAVIGNRPSFM